MPDMECTWWLNGWPKPFGEGDEWNHCCIHHDLGGTLTELGSCVTDTKNATMAIVMVAGINAFGFVYVFTRDHVYKYFRSKNKELDFTEESYKLETNELNGVKNMGFKLTASDEKKLIGVNPDLVDIIRRAAKVSTRKFRVLEGLRSISRQRQLVRKGASKTMNSRHIRADNGFGHAVDIAPIVGGKVSWDWKYYHPLAKVIKQVAKDIDVPIEWGGDWRSFKDGPHWQLPWKTHPGKNRQIRKFADMATSREVQGSTVGTTTGGFVTVDAISDIQASVEEAQGTIASGDMIKVALGVIIILASLYALYARWDSAGRPMPFQDRRDHEEEFDHEDHGDYEMTGE